MYTCKIVLSVHSCSLTSSHSGGLPSEGSSAESSDNTISPWWENVRHSLAQSTATSRALSLASVCRVVAMEISTASKKVQVWRCSLILRRVPGRFWYSVKLEIIRQGVTTIAWYLKWLEFNWYTYADALIWLAVVEPSYTISRFCVLARKTLRK